MTQQRAQQERRSSLELYEASSRAREAIVSLGIAAEHGRARLKERACLVARNHLVTILGLTNAQRAGALTTSAKRWRDEVSSSCESTKHSRRTDTPGS